MNVINSSLQKMTEILFLLTIFYFQGQTDTSQKMLLAESIINAWSRQDVLK